MRKLTDKLSSENNSLIGMDSRLEELCAHLNVGNLNDVRIIGICGMGGIGKTSIARTVFQRLSCQFEGSSFLADVREVHEKHGIVPLQEQLLSQILVHRSVWIQDAYNGITNIKESLCCKRVLVVLDDVNQTDQLNLLAAMRNWFGCGSRIIITTRDENLLLRHGVDKIYRVEGLNCDDALQLFCLKAFKKDLCPDDYRDLANHFLKYSNGLPLAIDVLGSFLFGRSIDEWRSALDRLKEIPNKEIMEKLSISFDGLEETEKNIFLDIACFFKGDEESYVKKVLKGCGFYPDIGIKILADKSLITVSNGRIWMHDLLQDMGREIVRRESFEEPGRRSRLWLCKDIYDVLLNNMGTEHIEGIVLDLLQQGDECFRAKGFSQMKRLRLLKLRGLRFAKGLEYLPNNLRYIEWHGYPFQSFPSTFQPDKLVELHMPCSNIQHLWKEMKPLTMLKVMDLRHSEKLIKTMNFREVPNLKELNLEGCTRLLEVHQSVGVLKGLTFLNLKNCKSLARLPSSVCDLKSLKVLNLHGCSKLDPLPERLVELTCLEKLIVGGVGGTEQSLAKSWNFLSSFWLFPRRNRNSLSLMLPSLAALQSLRTLDLRDCNLTESVIPNDLSCFPLLQELHLSGNDIVTLPSSIIQLSKLEDFRIANCKRLKSLPELPSSILYLNVEGCTSLQSSIPRSVSREFRLENIRISNCKMLESLPDFSSSVIHLSVDGFTSLESFPIPLGEHGSKPMPLTFLNQLKLIEIQGNKSTTFARLTSYIHFLLRHSQQGFFNPSSQVTMCFRGSDVPAWFNYQGVGSSLEMQLPPHWCTNKLQGFVICAVIRAHEPSSSKTCAISCDLHAWVTPNQILFLGSPVTQIPADICVGSDQFLFNFIPISPLNCVDWRDVPGRLKASFFSEHLTVKYCGFRLVYDTDINELLQCNRDSENLRPRHDNVFNKGKRSHDYGDGGVEELNEDVDSDEELHSKRVKPTNSKQELKDKGVLEY